MAKYDIKKFAAEREELNESVLKYSGLNVKRFFNIDTQTYNEGALPLKIKELMGLLISLGLRCDYCIQYHLLQCHEAGATDEELEETLAIGLVVGGSITIPHIRKIWSAWDELKEK